MMGLALHLCLQFGRSFDIGSRSQLRPFFEGRVGVENLLRAGMDLEIGRLTRSDLMIRDGITGQRYRTITSGGGRGSRLLLA
jgi:hypothetical protein